MVLTEDKRQGKARRRREASHEDFDDCTAFRKEMNARAEARMTLAIIRMCVCVCVCVFIVSQTVSALQMINKERIRWSGLGVVSPLLSPSSPQH